MAARHLGVSNPTFTRLIKQAEQQCGFPLFERTTTGTFPTAQGRDYLVLVRELQDAHRKFQSGIRHLGEPRGGALSISCGPLATRTLLEPVLAAMLRARPDLHLKIHVSATIEPLDALMRRTIDVAIADLTHTPDFEGLEVALVPKGEIFLYARPEHPVHEPSPRSIGSVLQYPIALPYFHRHWRGLIEQAIRAEGPAAVARPHIPQIECDDYALISEMASKSDILTAGTRDTFALEVQSGILRELALTSRIFWNLSAVKLKSADFPELNEFWQMITSQG